MKVKEVKTVRFDALVKVAGKPEQVTLWTKPEEDREFMKAVKARRVVTVIQRNVGTKKDYGLVGFFEEKNATFLVFPKSMKEPDGTKVVGIKYERVTSQEPKGELFKPKKGNKPGVPMREKRRYVLEESDLKSEPRGKRAEKKAAVKVAPAPGRFSGTIQLVATQTIRIEVEAANKAAAMKLLKARAVEAEVNLKGAEVKRAVKNVRKVGS